ncbi:MAG: cytidine deaminase [Tannerellaceae bacterium]|nr:cytidine deaminase [Tannerellaceae bacterium]MCD8265191.1 cytidine deaminase [Tannerellaceae bacterium]
MKEVSLSLDYHIYRLAELPAGYAGLLARAREATENAYIPYSGFRVGCALLLANGAVVTGSNQENVAYPSGLCAERVALFHAGHAYPHIPVLAIAISAVASDGSLPFVSPCGACRQVLLETESRGGKTITILLDGPEGVVRIDGVQGLLPFSFGTDYRSSFNPKG